MPLNTAKITVFDLVICKIADESLQDERFADLHHWGYRQFSPFWRKIVEIVKI